MRPSRGTALVLVGLAPLGTIVGHTAGYALAGHPAGLSGAHRHLAPVAWLGAAAAASVLAWAAGGRGTGRRPRVGRLAAGQLVLFVALEAAEHVAGGHGVAGVVADPATRWGLAAQVVAAVALVLATVLARAGGERVRALLSAPAGAGGAEPARRHPGRRHLAPRLRLASPASERGPPSPLVPAPA